METTPPGEVPQVWRWGWSYPKGVKTYGLVQRPLEPKLCKAKVRPSLVPAHKALMGQCGRIPDAAGVYCWQHVIEKPVGNKGRKLGSWAE